MGVRERRLTAYDMFTKENDTERFEQEATAPCDVVHGGTWTDKPPFFGLVVPYWKVDFNFLING